MELKNLPSVEQEKWNRIFNMCHENEEFKQELISDPVLAIEKRATGERKKINLRGFKLVVTDQSDPSTLYVNIPANEDDVELTEEQLEWVAGGHECCGITVDWL